MNFDDVDVHLQHCAACGEKESTCSPLSALSIPSYSSAIERRNIESELRYSFSEKQIDNFVHAIKAHHIVWLCNRHEYKYEGNLPLDHCNYSLKSEMQYFYCYLCDAARPEKQIYNMLREYIDCALISKMDKEYLNSIDDILFHKIRICKEHAVAQIKSTCSPADDVVDRHLGTQKFLKKFLNRCPQFFFCYLCRRFEMGKYYLIESSMRKDKLDTLDCDEERRARLLELSLFIPHVTVATAHFSDLNRVSTDSMEPHTETILSQCRLCKVYLRPPFIEIKRDQENREQVIDSLKCTISMKATLKREFETISILTVCLFHAYYFLGPHTEAIEAPACRICRMRLRSSFIEIKNNQKDRDEIITSLNCSKRLKYILMRESADMSICVSHSFALEEDRNVIVNWKDCWLCGNINSKQSMINVPECRYNRAILHSELIYPNALRDHANTLLSISLNDTHICSHHAPDYKFDESLCDDPSASFEVVEEEDMDCFSGSEDSLPNANCVLSDLLPSHSTENSKETDWDMGMDTCSDCSEPEDENQNRLTLLYPNAAYPHVFP